MTILIGLSQNIALLISLTFIYGLLSPRVEQLSRRYQDLVKGLIFSLFAVISMTLPIQIQPGLFLDGRTVMILIAGIYGGIVPGIITTLIVAVYRIFLGGIGVPGALVSAVTALTLGVVLYRYSTRQGKRPDTRLIIITGVAQALIGSLWSILISGVSVEIILQTVPASVLLYPLGLLLISALINHQQRNAELERTLREDEQRFRAIFNTAFQLTVLTKTNGIVLEANQAALNFGSTCEAEVSGKCFWDANWWRNASEEQTRQIKQSLENAAQGKVVRFEMLLANSAGEAKAFDLSIRPVPGANGGVEMLLFEGRDITALKELEAQKVNLMVERERGVLLKKFISDVSHDLRTPLAVMRLNLELVRRAKDPQKLQQRVEMLAAQEQHLTRLLTDMMTMLSLDDGQSAFKFKHIDPYFVAQMAADSNHSAAQNKQIEFRFNRALDPLLIRGDQVELERALSKLIINAISYTPAEGTITLSVFAENNNVVIELRDSGIGISEADLPHIFQRFYRADQARSMDTGGTGLGLAIVKKIVEAHGGRIEVESVVGNGTTFRLLLPLVQDETAVIESAMLRN